MTNTVLITGASSIIGKSLLHRLFAKGSHVLAVSRDKYFHNTLAAFNSSEPDVMRTCYWDMTTENVASSELDEICKEGQTQVNSLVHCAPLWLLPEHLHGLSRLGIKRVIAFSSTSIDGKSATENEMERQIVQQLIDAEQQLISQAKECGIRLTLFRPTLIYGHGKGLNLAFIAKVIQRLKFFPLVTGAKGLRRPVHADDLAEAVCLSLTEPKSYGKTYVLSGSEVMTYEQMVEKIFAALHVPVRIIKLPLMLYRLIVSVFSACTKIAMTPAMADRMREDLDFDFTLAQQDFAYTPGPFLPNGINDILSVELESLDKNVS